MGKLRVTATFEPPLEGAAESAALAALAGCLHGALGDGQQLTRSAALHLPGTGLPTITDPTASPVDRIFTLRLPDGDVAHNHLRALGGWLMRHPGARLAIKADGPGGGVSLRLSGWSAIAFAAAAARIDQHLRSVA